MKKKIIYGLENILIGDIKYILNYKTLILSIVVNIKK